MMKGINWLDGLLERAVTCGMFGTKMRALVKSADAHGVALVLGQGTVAQVSARQRHDPQDVSMLHERAVEVAGRRQAEP